MINKFKLFTVIAVIALLTACGGGGDGGTTVTSCVTLPTVGYTPPGVGVPVSCTTTVVPTTPTPNTAGLCCFSTPYSFFGGQFVPGNPVIRACGAGETPTRKC